MKVVVREAAAGDLDDILDWISSSVARMSEATSETKRTLASDFALRAPGYAFSYEQSAQAEPGEGGCWCGVGQHGGGIYPLTIRRQDVRKLPFVSKVLRTAQPPVRRREADAFPKMALVVLKPHENDFRSAKRDLGT